MIGPQERKLAENRKKGKKVQRTSRGQAGASGTAMLAKRHRRRRVVAVGGGAVRPRGLVSGLQKRKLAKKKERKRTSRLAGG